MARTTTIKVENLIDTNIKRTGVPRFQINKRGDGSGVSSITFTTRASDTHAKLVIVGGANCLYSDAAATTLIGNIFEFPSNATTTVYIKVNKNVSVDIENCFNISIFNSFDSTKRFFFERLNELTSPAIYITTDFFWYFKAVYQYKLYGLGIVGDANIIANNQPYTTGYTLLNFGDNPELTGDINNFIKQSLTWITVNNTKIKGDATSSLPLVTGATLYLNPDITVNCSLLTVTKIVDVRDMTLRGDLSVFLNGVYSLFRRLSTASFSTCTFSQVINLSTKTFNTISLSNTVITGMDNMLSSLATANWVNGGFLTLKKNDITSASDTAIETIRNKGVTVRIIA